MLSEIQKSVIVKALRIRQKNGENLEEIINDYDRLTLEEKEKILDRVKQCC